MGQSGKGPKGLAAGQSSRCRCLHGTVSPSSTPSGCTSDDAHRRCDLPAHGGLSAGTSDAVHGTCVNACAMISVLQRKKRRLREIQWFAQDPKAQGSSFISLKESKGHCCEPRLPRANPGFGHLTMTSSHARPTGSPCPNTTIHCIRPHVSQRTSMRSSLLLSDAVSCELAGWAWASFAPEKTERPESASSRI